MIREKEAMPEGNPGKSDSIRRRMLKGAVVSVPLIMTVTSRPVLANHCSVSGTLSGNLSTPHDHICVGLTPGYWGQHPYEWPSPYYAGDCLDGGHDLVGKHCRSNEYQQNGTLFHDHTFGFIGTLFGDMTMMEVIQQQGYEDKYQLGAHAVAALLNATQFGEESFGYTPQQIRDMWASRYLSDPEGLKYDFQLLNERGT